jgi:PqqD family protein of HPr-rel-A system
MRRRPLAHLALSDSGFLFDTRTGHTYTLNKTATQILKLRIDGVSRERVTEQIVKRFDVAHDLAGRDVAQFIERLRELGIEEGNDVAHHDETRTQLA